MEREQWNRLLAEYATGGLSEEEKKALFTAALADQELFDQLMEEDELRETMGLPGARNRLIDSLQEDLAVVEMAGAAPVPMLARSAAPAPEPIRKKVDRAPAWLAWAAGLGVVFVSGALTYVLFDEKPAANTAHVTSNAPSAKPFVEPPAVSARASRQTEIETPPKMMADARRPASAPIVSIPLPTAPPPPSPAPQQSAEALAEQRTDKDLEKSPTQRPPERDTVQSQFRAGQQQQPQQAPLGGSQSAGESLRVRRQSAPAPATAANSQVRAESREEKAKEAPQPYTIWRRSADGVWIRVPAGDSIDRADTIAIRYVPVQMRGVALWDQGGQLLLQKTGEIGVEMELRVPPAALQRAPGQQLLLSLAEAVPAAGPGAGVGGALARKTASAPVLQINIPLR